MGERKLCAPLAIYARVSTEEQAKWSIEAQVEMCRDWAAALGYDLDAARVYTDIATGKDIKRPGLAQLLVDRDQLGDLVVYRLDRLTRSVHDWCHLVEALHGPRAGQAPTIICQAQAIDLTRPDGRAMAYMVVTFAELERETISARTADALARRRGRPGGYDHLLPTLKQLRESGLSLRQIATKISASVGEEIAHSTVRFLLKKLGL